MLLLNADSETIRPLQTAFNQFVPAHDTVAFTDQNSMRSKIFGSTASQFRAAAQFTATRVEAEIFK